MPPTCDPILLPQYLPDFKSEFVPEAPSPCQAKKKLESGETSFSHVLLPQIISYYVQIISYYVDNNILSENAYAMYQYSNLLKTLMISDFHALRYSNHACILTTSGRYLTISSVIFFWNQYLCELFYIDIYCTGDYDGK